MKLDVLKRLIVLLSCFIIFFVVSIFFYNRLHDRFMDRKVDDLLTSTNSYSATSLNFKLTEDYNIIKRHIIEKHQDLDALNNANIKINDTNVIAFGKVDNNSYIFNGIPYVANNNVITSDYINQPISFYNLEVDFTINSSEVHNEDIIIYNFDGIVAMIDSNDYLSSFNKALQESAVKNDFFIVEPNGKICYANVDVKATQFFDLLRLYKFSETNVKKLIDDFNHPDKVNKERVVADVKYKDKDYYLTYTTISEGLSNDKLILVQLFENQEVEANFNVFILPLIILLCAYVFLIMLIIVIMYSFIVRRNKEIQLSIITYSANEKCIFKVNRVGKILSANFLARKIFGNIENLAELKPINIDYDMMTIINRKLEFVIKLEHDENISYYRFMVLKNFTTYYALAFDTTNYYSKYLDYRERSRISHLTNLPNINKLTSDIDKVINAKEPAALMQMRVLKFDTYHSLFNNMMCDEIIKRIAIILKEAIDVKNIYLYHLVDDNFAILFRHLENTTLPKDYATKIIEAFGKPLEVDGNYLDIKCRFGCVMFDYQNLTLTSERMKQYSDIVMNKMITSSSDYYGEYDLGLNRFLSKERVMFEDLKEAIKNKEFEMYLQPQYNNESNMIVGFESLIRWNNPKYKYQSPSAFIALAEQNNMINKIGEIVIEKTFELAKKLENEDLTISLNVSPIQILQSGFVSHLLDLLDKYQLQASKIAIEITETFLMSNFDLVIEKMNLLKNHGFKLHLDDFGTGWSSLAYLKTLPFDTIKIDREFTKYLNTDKATRIIVQKIIAIANGLDLNIICEGVETNEENTFLAKNGCHIIQGYLISKPIPFDEAVQLFNDYKSGKVSITTKKKNAKEKTE